MSVYRDSVGNHYARIVHGGPDLHKAKPSKGGTAKFGRNKRRPRVGGCGCEFCRAHPHLFR